MSLKASGRYAPSRLDVLERTVALFAEHAGANDWPPVSRVTTAHVKEHRLALRERPRWFGDRAGAKPEPISPGYLGAQRRRLKRFFGWLRSSPPSPSATSKPWLTSPAPSWLERPARSFWLCGAGPYCFAGRA